MLARRIRALVDTTKLPSGGAAEGVRRDRLIPLRMYHDLDNDPRVRVVGLSVQEPFSVYIKAALVVGAIISSPFVFYYLWNFVAVGLYPHEKQYVHMFLPISLGLFLAGVMLAFFVVFQFVLTFLFQFYDWMGIDPDPRITDWLTFVLIMPLGFGISFQLPLVMLFLERIGVFRTEDYTGHWRISDPGDLRAGDGADAERRVQHGSDGVAADSAVLCRRVDVQVHAATRGLGRALPSLRRLRIDGCNLSVCERRPSGYDLWTWRTSAPDSLDPLWEPPTMCAKKAAYLPPRANPPRPAANPQPMAKPRRIRRHARAAPS